MNTQLLDSTVQQIRAAQPNSQNSVNSEAAEFVNDLFKSLQVAYPAWKQAFGTEQDLKLTKKSWIRAFAESGITRNEQVALGMKRARQDQSDFFPSSGKFITWCKPTPEDFGLPTSSDAWREACAHCHEYTTWPWSAAAIFETGDRVKFYDIQRGAVREKEFAEVYLRICEEVMQGKVFKGPGEEKSQNALEWHSNGKKIKSVQNLSKGNQTLSHLKGLFR
jgi:hypothetical protein